MTTIPLKDTFGFAAFSASGEKILTCGQAAARVWCASSGELLHTVKAAPWEGGVATAAFSSDERLLVTGHSQSTGAVRVWDLGASRRIAALRGHESTIRDLAFSPHGDRVLASAVDGTVRAWSLRHDAIRGRARDSSHVDALPALALDGVRPRERDKSLPEVSPEGAPIHDPRLVLGVCPAGWTRALDAEFSGGFCYAVTHARDADGSRGIVSIWDLESGAAVEAVQHDDGSVFAIALDQRASRFVTGALRRQGFMGISRLWTVGSNAPGLVLDERRALSSAAFSSDGQRLAAGCFDGSVSIWDVASAERIGRTWCCGEGTSALRSEGDLSRGVRVEVAFSADGARLITTCSTTCIATVWDPREGRVVCELKGHGRRLNAACFSPDGTRVLTTSDDFTARIWDAETGALLHTFV